MYKAFFMYQYVVFLRGINVGAHNRIKMADLKNHLSQLNFTQIKTYIQSGNLILSTQIDNENEIEQKIKEQILKSFGFEVPVLAIAAQRYISILDKNPMVEENLEHLYVTLFKPTSNQMEVKMLDVPDRFYINHSLGVVYLTVFPPYHKSKYSNAFFEKKLRLETTSRNWKTMLKMKSLLEQLPD